MITLEQKNKHLAAIISKISGVFDHTSGGILLVRVLGLSARNDGTITAKLLLDELGLLEEDRLLSRILGRFRQKAAWHLEMQLGGSNRPKQR